jgi:hypothetical protein
MWKRSWGSTLTYRSLTDWIFWLNWSLSDHLVLWGTFKCSAWQLERPWATNNGFSIWDLKTITNFFLIRTMLSYLHLRKGRISPLENLKFLVMQKWQLVRLDFLSRQKTGKCRSSHLIIRFIIYFLTLRRLELVLSESLLHVLFLLSFPQLLVIFSIFLNEFFNYRSEDPYLFCYEG